MFEPASAVPELAKMSMGELSQRRGQLGGDLEKKEAEWLALSEMISAVDSIKQGMI
jgi:ATP-binding cassette subfamily F protein 3